MEILRCCFGLGATMETKTTFMRKLKEELAKKDIRIAPQMNLLHYHAV